MDVVEHDMLGPQPIQEISPPPDCPVSKSVPPGQGLISERYEVLSVLGVGSSATVVCVLDRSTQRRWALKRLHSDRMSSTPAILGFEYESALLSVLDHPAIPRVVDRGIHLGSSYMVMSVYERGSALQQGRMAVDAVVDLGIQVATVLEHLHERDVIHRDVTPGNIVQHADGRWALIDFGVAQGPWRTTHTVGSFAFMAPEQRLDEPVDGRADVYSLCSTLFFMMTGDNPVDLFSTSPNSDRFDGLPDGLRDVIVRGTRLDGRERIGSARELIERLERA